MSPSKHKQKKRKSRKNQAISFTERLKKFWIARRPVVLFILGFAGLMGLFYAFWLTAFFRTHVFEPTVNLTASLSGFLLNLLGQDVSVAGDSLYAVNFGITIKRGCDALEPVALFVSLITAFPVSPVKKLPGILLGSLFLFAANLFRVVSLFLIGAYYPEIFKLMHIEIWQVLFIFLVIVCWILWMQWAAKGKGTEIKSR